mgnify:CR=1 FL=1
MELTREQHLAMHRSMVRIRLFEETAGKLMETGKMPGFLHLYVGQEVRMVSPLSDPSNPDATGTPIPFNRDYRIAATFFRSDKTITLVGIEKLYGAYWHDLFLSRNTIDPPAKSGRRSVEARKGTKRLRPKSSVAGDVSAAYISQPCG